MGTFLRRMVIPSVSQNSCGVRYFRYWLGRRDGFQTFRLNKEVTRSDILSIKQILDFKEIKNDKSP